MQPHSAADRCKVLYIVWFESSTGSRLIIMNLNITFVQLNAKVQVCIEPSKNLQETPVITFIYQSSYF